MAASSEADIVIGIDPGTEITGYGIVAGSNGGITLLEAGIIKGGKEELPGRLIAIYDELLRILNEFRPFRMAVEELYSHYKHPRTSIIMGHARGVVLLAAAQAGIEVHSYPATKIKKSITGDGRASKDKVRRMVSHLLNLSMEPKYHDTSDALAAALTDLIRQGNKTG